VSAVIVENLAKRYTLGLHRAGYDTLRDKISGLFGKKQTKNEGSTEHWALRDVSFSVNEGEVVGLIGRNGAGKSTLLKILSRITCPTRGRVVMKGRLASLLEVGTGFHPELTGRENIYLNGAILGMSRAEVRACFDQIVAFSQVEKFLDTQVKFYSSGMYVRLAFSVAAHLTPEVLIVDEVLAVGDQEFQKRCLGRMRDVASSGRTVLFVSHSMPAVESLCSRAILLAGGQVEIDGPPRQVISRYLASSVTASTWDVTGVTDREGSGRARFTKVEILAAQSDTPLSAVEFGKPFRIRMHYRAQDVIENPIFGVAVLTDRDDRVFLTDNVESQHQIQQIHGNGHVDCLVKEQWLLPGTYQVEIWIADIRWSRFVDHLRPVGQIEVSVDPAAPYISDLSLSGRGLVFCPTAWSASAEVEPCLPGAPTQPFNTSSAVLQ
jgi:lipopolysaccharide transport system ATP-binding protein